MKPQIATLSFCVLIAGCASTEHIEKFSAYADLGHKNQANLSTVIDKAIESNIDANSRELEDARALVGGAWPKGQTGDSILDQQNTAVIETTRGYAAVKRHAALLDDYFLKLAALAKYDSAPISASTSSTVEALQGLSKDLANFKIGDEALPKASGTVATVVVRGIKSRLLERELQANGDVINRELDLQERLLSFISKRMAADNEMLAQREILDKLAAPFGDLSKPLPEGWSENRKAILLAQAASSDPAADAAKVSQELRIAYLGLLEGKLGPEEVARISSDLGSLTALIESLDGAKPGVVK